MSTEKENKTAEGTKPAESKTKDIVTVESLQAVVDAQALEIEAFTSKNSELEAEIEAFTSKNSELEAEIEAFTSKNSELEAELEVYKAKYSDVSKETPGTYTSKKLKGPAVKFKTGCVQFPFNGEMIKSKDALKDAEIMDALITMGAGIIEVVND